MWAWFQGAVSDPAVAISAATSLVVTLLTLILTPIGTRYADKFKANLDDSNSARSARRDYEYDARKRLYVEIEPLLFQLHEAAEEALYRVKSLARTARNGDLDWLAREGYYLRSTIHRLLLPAVIFRIVQRRMTFVDLTVDDTIQMKYYLMKLYAFSFTDDFEFARRAPEFLYNPDDATGALLKTQPATFARQGLYVGALESATDAMLIDKDGVLRPMTFGEFDDAFGSGGPDTGPFARLVALYRDFDPVGRPVLARMLHAQGCIAALLLRAFRSSTTQPNLRDALQDFVDSPDFTQEFSWDKNGPAIDGPIVRTYVAERFSRIAGKGWDDA